MTYFKPSTPGHRARLLLCNVFTELPETRDAVANFVPFWPIRWPGWLAQHARRDAVLRRRKAAQCRCHPYVYTMNLVLHSHVTVANTGRTKARNIITVPTNQRETGELLLRNLALHPLPTNTCIIKDGRGPNQGCRLAWNCTLAAYENRLRSCK
jgi:hypothetical protein